jgi:hypothetical protein
MAAHTPPSPSSGVVDDKDLPSHHVEHIATHDRVPGHGNYYEKNGLRTYGDGEDHDTEPDVRYDPLCPVDFADSLCRCHSSA